MKNPQEYWL